MPRPTKPLQAVTGCPSRVKVAPMLDAEFAIAPPQNAPFCNCQLPPLAPAVNVLMPNALEPACVAPAANSLSEPSGIVSSARPPLPSQPVATVDVPIVLPVE